MYHRVISKYANEVIGYGLYDYDKLKQFKDIMEESSGQLINYISSDIREDSFETYVKRKIL